MAVREAAVGSTAVEVIRAPAKLTISLRVVGVRPDGYHLIDAEMVTLDLADELAFARGDGLEVIDAGGGPPVPADDDNLVRTRAARRRSHRARAADQAHPGRGGARGRVGRRRRGAAVGRRRRPRCWRPPSGADVAFCVTGGRARVTGIGEVVEPLPFEDRTYTLLIPPFGCSTPAVYRAWDELGGPTADRPERPRAGRAAGRSRALVEWRDRLRARHRTGAPPRRQRQHVVRRGSLPRRRSGGGAYDPTIAPDANRPPGEGGRSGAPAGSGRVRRATVRYLPARRCQRVRFSIFLCFFLRIRLRRFLISEPMGRPT